MEKRLTKGEKWLFAAPLLFLVIAGAMWMQTGKASDALLVPEARYISSHSFSPDGKRLVVVFQSNNAAESAGRVYDVKSRAPICDLQKPTLLTANLPPKEERRMEYGFYSWSGDGKSIVASNGCEAAIWDAKSGLLKANFSYLTTKSNQSQGRIQFSPDGKTLVGGGVPPAIYDVTTGKRLNSPDKSISANIQTGLSESKRWLARYVSSQNSNQERFDVVDARTQRRVWSPELSSNVTFGWSGEVLCVQGYNVTQEKNYLLLWDGKTRRQLPSPTFLSRGESRRFWLNPDKRTLVYLDGQYNNDQLTEELAAWDFRANRLLWRRKIDSSIDVLQLSPNGKWLAMEFSNGAVETLQVFDKAGKLRYEHQPALVFGWSPDSTQLAFVTGKQRLWGASRANQLEIHRIEE